MTTTDELIAESFIKSKLLKIRKASGITQEQLSNKTGLSTNTISRLESKVGTAPNLNTIIRYCDALGYEVTIHRKGESIKSGLKE